MRFRWPKDTEFRRETLDVQQRQCSRCGKVLHVCAHRTRRIYTMQKPLKLLCRLAHCSDPACLSRPTTLSPEREISFALPGWLIGWDVFCFIGHRRFARHWSVPQIHAELLDSYRIQLSVDSISNYIRHYQTMVAARQQDFALFALAYRDIDFLVLSIDGLQPEKGHETLYVVREVISKRIWFAQALLSSTTAEIRRLLVRARELAQRLGKPVLLWISDKQDAFVKGIALEFNGVAHRYCLNHFLRGLAKPTSEADSRAKVAMRKKVRGLRDIERAVQQARQNAEVLVTEGLISEASPSAPAAEQTPGTDNASASRKAPTRKTAKTKSVQTVKNPGDDVVLAYCAAVRGILNDDQGGPLHPPGMRMAQALKEVRASLGRNLELNKLTLTHKRLQKLADCIDVGLAEVSSTQEEVAKQLVEIEAVAATLDVESGTRQERRVRYHRLRRSYRDKPGEFYGHLARMMKDWSAGLFVGPVGKKANRLPVDNLDLERWFRKPKGHERKIHGHSHAGVRIVQEGPTLLLVLNAHETHPAPFTAEDLLPYRDAEVPQDQLDAIARRIVMRKARSKKNDPPSWLT